MIGQELPFADLQIKEFRSTAIYFNVHMVLYCSNIWEHNGIIPLVFSYRLLDIVNDWDDNDTIWFYKSTGHTTKTEENEGRNEEREMMDAYSLLQHMIPIIHHCDLLSITIIIMRVMIILMRSFLVINHDPHFS